ncbi:excinuclease ABC subunit UvrA [Luteibaculum oceani]|uniref:UvrABC system protein A n=1 Tax=Luteibaculum oceani TaxID=1294296 RepID=A0A5C6UUS5_9FLAO|nr:excinuclease ABC subunit UvrA [Luteibaculum oceani]TXC77142.1 excinuclease ABC subunit A [Luteibaculum oceani]
MQKAKEDFIHIKGARVHNLKNVDVKIPRNSFTVITGVSGSGKSSLAFDTLYAEGQRRYVESLSSYARQFLGRLEKPDVDQINGLSPAIAIEQKVIAKNSRSTVATTTEIYDYLKLLFARIGATISPISGQPVKRHTVDDVIDCIKKCPSESAISVLAPFPENDRLASEQLKLYTQQGFARIYIVNQGFQRIESAEADQINSLTTDKLKLAVDRIRYSEEDFDLARVTDGINTAFFEGHGKCELLIETPKGKEEWEEFSNKFELDGMTFEEPSEAFFSFNNPYGACGSCEGFGSIIGIDPELVIPDPELSVYNDAIACWRGDKMGEWKDQLIRSASEFNFPIHRPINELSEKEYELLWNGNKHFKGLNRFFKYLEEKSYKIQYRVMLSRYRGKTLCPDCKGSRIRKDAAYVKIAGKSIQEILNLPVSKAKDFFSTLELSEYERQVSDRLLVEINNRLTFLSDVGLSYLTLDRLANTLSGGESQRINLATSLGSSLVGSTYILDEPSIGLHPRDTENLIGVLKRLQKLGNTVVVVEHDKEIMRQADYLVDMGPLAGSNGGEVCFQGDLKALVKSSTLTAKYLSGKEKLESEQTKAESKKHIEIVGAREHNLKNIDAKFPINRFSVVTGVSGSGKSTLIGDILYPAATREKGLGGKKPGKHKEIKGLQHITQIEYVDQNPIGKSSRSNPVTYVKAFDEIRNLFAGLPASKTQGFKSAHFSFNVPGGRCEECEGEGYIKIEMQFMADVQLTCESCKGKRYKDDVLDVRYQDHSIYDILNSTIDDAIALFSSDEKTRAAKKIVDKLTPLQQVGLGYLKLGQSSNTLSGGEAQRIKLASFLSKGNSKEKILFLFDEPTTGLHFHDITNLLKSFRLLLAEGHTIICIEHNLDLIKQADWIVDIGPDGGENGGNLMFQGAVNELQNCRESVTAGYL